MRLGSGSHCGCGGGRWLQALIRPLAWESPHAAMQPSKDKRQGQKKKFFLIKNKRATSILKNKQTEKKELSFPVAQCVKDLALSLQQLGSLQWCGLDPWPGNFPMSQIHSNKNKTKQKKKPRSLKLISWKEDKDKPK